MDIRFGLINQTYSYPYFDINKNTTAMTKNKIELKNPYRNQFLKYIDLLLLVNLMITATLMVTDNVHVF